MPLNTYKFFRAMSINTPEAMTMDIDWYKTLSEEEVKNIKKSMVDFNIRTSPKKKKKIKFSRKKYKQICLKKTNKRGMKTWNNTERINVTIPWKKIKRKRCVKRCWCRYSGQFYQK